MTIIAISCLDKSWIVRRCFPQNGSLKRLERKNFKLGNYYIHDTSSPKTFRKFLNEIYRWTEFVATLYLHRVRFNAFGTWYPERERICFLASASVTRRNVESTIKTTHRVEPPVFQSSLSIPQMLEHDKIRCKRVNCTSLWKLASLVEDRGKRRPFRDRAKRHPPRVSKEFLKPRVFPWGDTESTAFIARELDSFWTR